MKFIQSITVTVILLLCLSGCKRGEGQAWGHIQAAYSSTTDAQTAASKGAFSIVDGKTEFRFTPRSTSTHVVGYDVEVAGWSSMKLKSEKELIDLLMTAMANKPEEIYSVVVPGLKHTELPHSEVADLNSFWEYFYEKRPHSGYSLSEVRSVLPQANRADFDRQIRSQKTKRPITRSARQSSGGSSRVPQEQWCDPFRTHAIQTGRLSRARNRLGVRNRKMAERRLADRE